MVWLGHRSTCQLGLDLDVVAVDLWVDADVEIHFYAHKAQIYAGFSTRTLHKGKVRVMHVD